jgi:hypothetical protein
MILRALALPAFAMPHCRIAAGARTGYYLSRNFSTMDRLILKLSVVWADRKGNSEAIGCADPPPRP